MTDTLRTTLLVALALYVLAAVVIAIVGDRFSRRHDVAGYGAAVLALLVFLASTAGPTLDHHHEIAQDGRGKTAYARR